MIRANCACEDAAPTENGHGPVADDERLRYFVTSPSDYKLRKPPRDPFNSAIFKRAFRKGMSTFRIDHAQPQEIELAAGILYDIQTRADQPEYNGVMGVVDFCAGLVRRFPESDERICCVLDTPIPPDRLSHADVVSAKGAVDEEEGRRLREKLFNRIGGVSAYIPSDQVTDCNLVPFLPRKQREEPH